MACCLGGAKKIFDFNGEELAVPEDAAALFQGFKIGKLALSHNMVYAPLTRSRALGTVHGENAVIYYSQRASKGGFMISEATPVCVEGHGYPCTPGIHTPEQIESWKPVTQAVHDKGASIFCQLWHVGRASHPEFQPEGKKPVAPSAIAITGADWTVYTPKGEGPFPYEEPRALDEAEIAPIVAQFATAAKNAIAAGFDGVEIHAANGYLINQFLADSSNKRTDGYGGSVEKRARFCLEVVAAVVAAVGAERVGIRIAPYNFFLDCTDSDPKALYSYLLPKLSASKLAYVHLIAARQFEATPADEPNQLAPMRKLFKGPAILAGGFDRATGAAAIKEGTGDAIAYGRFYLANPDLPKRFALKAELNAYDRNSFYNPTMPIEGYTDYPFLGQEATPGAVAVDPYALKAKN